MGKHLFKIRNEVRNPHTALLEQYWRMYGWPEKLCGFIMLSQPDYFYLRSYPWIGDCRYRIIETDFNHDERERFSGIRKNILLSDLKFEDNCITANQVEVSQVLECELFTFQHKELKKVEGMFSFDQRNLSIVFTTMEDTEEKYLCVYSSNYDNMVSDLIGRRCLARVSGRVYYRKQDLLSTVIIDEIDSIFGG